MKNNNGICSLSHLVYRQNTSLLRIKSKVENQHLVLLFVSKDILQTLIFLEMGFERFLRK
jgi:hypothetical protein